MKNHNVFDISDYAAQRNPGWRVRWGAENSNAVLLVDMSTPKESSWWKLVWCDQDPEIALTPGGEFLPKPEVKIHEYNWLITDPRDKTLPRILSQSLKDHFSNVPAPRHRNSEPYIRRDTAIDLESQFFEKFVAPYLDSHTVYSVYKSGSKLCQRLGISPYADLFVSHYDEDTFQNDAKIRVGEFPIEDRDKPVLIIDDMVSSGHTAAAILKEFEKAGLQKVRYAALFNVVASRENHDIDSSIETLKNISNFYWMYGRGMDLKDEESRRTLHIYGADKSYEESEDEVRDMIESFKLRGVPKQE